MATNASREDTMHTLGRDQLGASWRSSHRVVARRLRFLAIQSTLRGDRGIASWLDGFAADLALT
jgi:hypothetical protein